MLRMQTVFTVVILISSAATRWADGSGVRMTAALFENLESAATSSFHADEFVRQPTSWGARRARRPHLTREMMLDAAESIPLSAACSPSRLGA